MKVFISWSGEQSRQIALALRDWLPLVIQAAKEPYMSDKDNMAGDLWDHIIATELEVCNFGIICLTPDNLESRWIHFEAGALSKAVGKARVVPLLYGLKKADVALPLSRFQMKQLDESGVLDTLKSMNLTLEETHRLKDSDLAKVFQNSWRSLKAQLDKVAAGPEARVRSERELLEEILELVRRNSIGTRFGLSRDSVPSKALMDRLASIAGPDGAVEATGRVITVRSPRFKILADSDDLTADETRFLRDARYDLWGNDMQLKLMDTDNNGVNVL